MSQCSNNQTNQPTRGKDDLSVQISGFNLDFSKKQPDLVRWSRLHGDSLSTEPQSEDQSLSMHGVHYEEALAGKGTYKVRVIRTMLINLLIIHRYNIN